MRTFRLFGAATPEETQRERDHRALARTAAAEGMVLLENDGVLPLRPQKIALYGAGARMSIRGGSGSGDMRERYSVNIEDGLKNAGFTIANPLWLDRFDQQYAAEKEVFRKSVEEKIRGYGPIRTMKMFDIIHAQRLAYPTGETIQQDELTDETDTALYVATRQAGEGGDRKAEKGDYFLTDAECENLRLIAAHYRNTILVVNCGGIMDLSVLDETDISAVVYIGQPGMECGNALADILTGQVTPSGKLTDTWAMRYDDYPNAGTYSYLNADPDNEDYTEGIYVGYRWFDAFHKNVRFPFGYGLSYTSFTTEFERISEKDDGIDVAIKVRNTGGCAGKEVVQMYIQKPKTALDKEPKSLVAFDKTRLLQPDETQTVSMHFPVRSLASFDSIKHEWIIEKGAYGLLLGNSVESASLCAVITTDADTVVERTSVICPMSRAFDDAKGNAAEQVFDQTLPQLLIRPTPFTASSSKPAGADPNITALVSQLKDEELILLCVGAGYGGKNYHITPGVAGRTTGALLQRGIPDINLSDGPAGLNVLQKIAYTKSGSPRYVDELPEDWQWGWVRKIAPFVMAKEGQGQRVYHYMTAFPSETVQAQTWNTELMEEIGRAVGKEMLEIGVTLWLAPGLNIHRNPLCGRNFEYYSEDPLVSGKMAAAVTRGVQSCGGVGVTVKHFCCNNREDNRDHVSENVSERALREIYLRGFRIVIEEAEPWAVMSSYNRVNGKYVANSRDLLTTVLREEWGFTGVVMSDWNATDKCSHSAAITAGNDLLMPGNRRVAKALAKAVKTGSLTRDSLERAAGRVLSVIFRSAVAKEFEKRAVEL